MADTFSDFYSDLVYLETFDLEWVTESAGPITLVVASASHALSSESPVISQVHTLVVAATGHTVSSESPAINVPLVVAQADHALVSDSHAITQVHTLVISEADHALVSDALVISQVHILSIEASNHALSSESPTVGSGIFLDVNGSGHALSSDSSVIVQTHTLDVNAAGHTLTSDEPVLSLLYLLDVDSTDHVIGSDNVSLTENLTILVSDTAHGITSDVLTLPESLILEITDASHVIESDNIIISQIIFESGDWATYRNLGAWEFNEQLNKFGYLNNPDWVPGSDATIIHKPCGHWHKGPLGSYSDIEYGHGLIYQVIDVLASKGEIAIGGYAYTPDYSVKYTVFIVDIDTGAIKFASSKVISGYSYPLKGLGRGNIVLRNIGGLSTVFYVNELYTTTDGNRYYLMLYKVNENGDARTIEILRGLDSYGISAPWKAKSLAASADGKNLVLVYALNYLGTVFYSLKVARSTDYGYTWETGISLGVYALENWADAVGVDCDSDGNFLIQISSTAGGSYGDGSIWRSTDNGATWDRAMITRISDLNTQTAFDISGTNCFIPSWGRVSSVWKTWLRYSEDELLWSWRYIDITADYNERCILCPRTAAACGNNLIIAGTVWDPGIQSWNVLYRTNDNGLTCTKIGEYNTSDPTAMWPLFVPSGESYIRGMLVSDGNVCVYSRPDYIFFNTTYRTLLVSKDGGYTFTQILIPVKYNTWYEVDTYRKAIPYEEPVVWSIGPKTNKWGMLNNERWKRQK